MATTLTVNGPIGARKTPDVSVKESVAHEALRAAGVCNYVFPTTLGPAKSVFLGDAEKYIVDAVNPKLEYHQLDLTEPAPAFLESATVPGLSWAGMAKVRGFQCTEQTVDKFGDQEAGKNPARWAFVVAALGDVGTVGILFGVDQDYASYGDTLVVLSGGTLELRLGGVSAFNMTTEADRSALHVYSYKYDPITDILTTYRDGVLVNSYGVEAAHPSTEFIGGAVQIGARSTLLSGDGLKAPNSSINAILVGNGSISDAQHADITDWLKEAFSI